MINRQDERSEIALGCYVVEFAPAHPNGSMPSEADWTRVGRMTQSDNLAVNIDRGTALDLRDMCNNRVAYQDEEPTIGYDFGLIDIPRAAIEMFADVEVTGDGLDEVIGVNSYRATKNYAVRFYAPGVIGSSLVTWPYCTVSIDPATWTRETGYTSMVHVNTLDVSGGNGGKREWITRVKETTGVPGPVSTPANPEISQAGETINVSFDKDVASLIANPAASWLTIAGTAKAWTLEAAANDTGEDLVATLVATGVDGSISNIIVVQPAAAA